MVSTSTLPGGGGGGGGGQIGDHFLKFPYLVFCFSMLPLSCFGDFLSMVIWLADGRKFEGHGGCTDSLRPSNLLR